jgi:hypothetical protein
MPVSGMAMMLKSFAIDPDEIRGNVEQFMAYMKAAADKINANQAIIEAKLDRIEKLIDPPGETVHIKENGLGTGVLVTTEKFPQELIDEANAGNFGAYKVGGQ